MLKRLAEAHPGAVVQLKQQYRMHTEICSLASNAIYNGKIGLQFCGFCCGVSSEKISHFSTLSILCLLGYLVNGVEVPRLQLQNYPKALSSQQFGSSSRWVQKVVNPFRPVVFVDTDGIGNTDTSLSVEKQGDIVALERTASRQTGGNMVNETEATLVARIVEALIAVGVSPPSIGVICPFNGTSLFYFQFCLLIKHRTAHLT